MYGWDGHGQSDRHRQFSQTAAWSGTPLLPERITLKTAQEVRPEWTAYPWKELALDQSHKPLSDGPLLRYLAVAAAVRERRPSRAVRGKALGL